MLVKYAMKRRYLYFHILEIGTQLCKQKISKYSFQDGVMLFQGYVRSRIGKCNDAVAGLKDIKLQKDI